MELLSNEGRLRLEEARNIIASVVSVGKKAYSKYETAGYPLRDFVFINFLERFTFNLEAISHLLAHFERNPNIEPSIGLLIRPNLLDYLTILYLFSYHRDITSESDVENLEKFEKQFNSCRF